MHWSEYLYIIHDTNPSPVILPPMIPPIDIIQAHQCLARVLPPDDEDVIELVMDLVEAYNNAFMTNKSIALLKSCLPMVGAYRWIYLVIRCFFRLVLAVSYRSISSSSFR